VFVAARVGVFFILLFLTVVKLLLEGVWGPRQRPHARTQVSRSLLQGVPEPGARTGGQQRQRLCSVRAGE